MKRNGLDQFLFYASVACFGLHAVSLTLMAPEMSHISGISLLAGLLFWVPLLLGVLAQTVVGIRGSNWRKARKHRTGHRKIGLFSFFSNRIGTVFDIAFLVSGVLFGASRLISKNSGFFSYFSLTFLVFFFETHCIFNGKNYNYIMQSMWVKPRYLRQTSAGTRRKSNDKEQNNNV